MKARITTGSFHVFGSGSGSAILRLANGKRITGSEPIDTDNGFIGYTSTEVNLYPKTRVVYNRGSYPGGSFRFEGTWEDLIRKHGDRLVKSL
jgi:hypothetical protein